MVRKAVVISGSPDLVEAASNVVVGLDGWSVAGTVGNGVGGIDLVRAFRPDGVFLDTRLAVFSSLQALKTIMAYRPTPIVVVSSNVDLDGVVLLESLRCGAADSFAKPAAMGWDSEPARQGLAAALVRASSIDGVPKGIAQLQPTVPVKCAIPNAPRDVVVISLGISGFSGLLSILNALPPDPGLSVLVVGSFQHLRLGVVSRYLSRHSTLATEHDVDEFRLEGGQVHVVDGSLGWRLSSRSTTYAVLSPGQSNEGPSVEAIASGIAGIVRGETSLIVLPGSPKEQESMECVPQVQVFRADRGRLPGFLMHGRRMGRVGAAANPVPGVAGGRGIEQRNVGR